MGKFFDHINIEHQKFIEDQHLFFVATAPLSPQGRINLSPKGLDSFSVLSPNEVGYMDLISSGNETSAHTLENGRITFMFCSFGKKPKILRLYGSGRTILPNSEDWSQYASNFTILPSTRQLIVADIDLVQTSCGFGVPEYDFVGHRSQLGAWAAKKGTDGIKVYQEEKNKTSLDGKPTGI